MSDWISELERAKRLLEAGALTQEEFEAEKLRLLPRPPALKTDRLQRAEGRAAKRKKPVSPMIIAVGVVGLVSACGALIYQYREKYSPIISSAEIAAFASAPKPSASGPPSTTGNAAPLILQQGQGPTSSALTDEGANASSFEFDCIGAYSNVSFSSESGDGSGLFVRIRPTGRVTFNSWEGGVFVGDVKISDLTADRISLEVRFAEFPDSSVVTLSCQQDRLKVASGPWGEVSLPLLNERQAAELEQG